MGFFMRRIDGWIVTLVCGVAMLVSGAGVQAQTLVPVTGKVVTPDVAPVPVAGRHEVVFTVERLGAYAIVASSDQGVGLTLVSRMTGLSAHAGEPGKRDGRLNVLLDKGQYKLITRGPGKGSGTAKIQIVPFVEKNGVPAPQLVESKVIQTTLGDREQRSYWINVTQERWIDVEAGGRALNDLRLWRDGSWLVGVAPKRDKVTPHEGQPLHVFRLVAHLEPGLYLLSAYGGPPEPWAKESSENPLFLRLGMPHLGSAGRQWHVISGLGIDRWLIRDTAHLIRIELPQARHLELDAGPWSEEDPFGTPDHVATIEKTSREPSAEVMADDAASGWVLVTVRGQAGQPYVLQYFNPQTAIGIKRSGRTWISTVATGPPEDTVDATGIVVEWDRLSNPMPQPAAAQVIHISGSKGWAVRCNLLGRLNVFLKVEDRGSYVVTLNGVAARFRIEPFFVYRPPEYQAPDWKRPGQSWDLDPGYYVLTVAPEKKGIVEISINPSSLLENLRAMLGKGKTPHLQLPMPAVQLGVVNLARGHDYTLFLNQRPGVNSGLVLRPAPVSIEDPLPVALRPGEKIRIPVRIKETSIVTALDEHGRRVPLSFDGTAWTSEKQVSRGTYTVTLASHRKHTIWCSLQATPLRLRATAPLPKLPPATLDQLPNFPKLEAGVPRFFDIDSGRTRIFQFTAPADALYRLETTGLLNTSGVLRSRVVTSLAHTNSGGSGRNFLMHRYLGSGTYEVTVKTVGASEGHAGIVLDQTRALDGGELVPGEPARVSLARGQAIEYHFRVGAQGTYRLRSFGLGGFSRCRLEDSDGWPLLRPGGLADITRSFEPGSYRLVMLPSPVAARRVTLLEKVTKPRSFKGHGPFTIALDQTVHARWMEPADGHKRNPDVWTFQLSGSTRVTISLSGEMLGTLKKIVGSTAKEVAVVPPVRGWSGPLEAGAYRLDVRCSRRNNRVDYRLRVSPEALLPGMHRRVRAPADIPIATDGGLIDISSFGRQDVSGRLLDAAGKTIAYSDDRPNDWNFLLTQRLAPGKYTLHVEPVGSDHATTDVRISRRAEKLLTKDTLPVDRTLEVHDGVVVLPIEGGPEQVLLASADGGGGALGLALERQEGCRWATVALRSGADPVIVMPRGNGGPLRVRIWSLDRRELSVRLRITGAAPQAVREGGLAKGVRLKPVPGFAPKVAVAAVTLSRPGTLRTPEPDVLWSNTGGVPLRAAGGGFLPAPRATGWIAAPVTGRNVVLRAVRQTLTPNGGGITVSIGAGATVPVDLAAGSAAAVAVIARSLDGQPVVSWQPASQGTTVATGGGWIARHAAIGVTLDPAASLAGIGLDGNLAGPADVSVRAFKLDLTPSQPLSWGRTSGSLDRRALVFDLPAGWAGLKLSLPAGSIAAIAAGDGVQDVVWAAQSARTEQMEVHGGRLIVAPAGRGGPFTVWLTRADGTRLALGPDTPVCVVQELAPGELRIRVAAGADSSRVLGTFGVGRAVFLSDEGHVLRGRSLAIGKASGTLVVHHGAGAAVAWLGTGDDRFSGVLHAASNAVPSPVELPASVRCDTARTLKTVVAKGMLFDVGTDGPTAFRFGHGSGGVTWLQDAGTRHVLVRKDHPELRVRPLGRPVTVRLAVTSVTAAGEGLGAAALLAPGDAKAYRFDVTEAGKIGAGVSSDPDAATATLLTPEGSVVGRGVVMMRTLKPGSYILLVRVPADVQAPVRIRPAIVGISRPPTGPPERIIRQYIEKERNR